LWTENKMYLIGHQKKHIASALILSFWLSLCLATYPKTLKYKQIVQNKTVRLKMFEKGLVYDRMNYRVLNSYDWTSKKYCDWRETDFQ